MRNANRVCHITTVHLPSDVRIFHKECKTLASAGYEVSLIAQHDKEEIIDGVHIIPLPKVKNRAYRILFLPIRVLSIVLRVKADVYHFHDPELMPVGVLLGSLTRKKVIYDVHEDYPKQILSKRYIPRIARKGIAYLIGMLECVSSVFFDGIVAATDGILGDFAYHRRAISVRNFPIMASFSNTVRIDRDSGSVLVLIYVGGLTEIRGIIQIVQALEFVNSNRRVKLILCGKFDPPDLEARVRILTGFEKVEYLGWMEPREVPGLLNRADVGIVCFSPEPNHIDAMPNKLFEYAVSGLPVVASNFPLWKEVVEGNKCGICVDPLNPKEIAEAIEYLIEHPDRARQMGENGRKAVLEKYNWERESKKLLELYQEIVG